MKQKLFEIVVCPYCKKKLDYTEVRKGKDDEIIEGSFLCKKCKKSYSISQGIPDFRSEMLLDKNSDYGDKGISLKKANIAYHDAFAKHYEGDASTYDLFTPYTKSRTAEIFDYVKKVTNAERHIDLGCGTGNLLLLGKGYFKESIGLDISPKMLSISKSRNFGAVCGDMENLPFEGGIADVVTCSSAIHHLPETEKVFKEIFRILKKGGIFYSDHDHNRSSVLLQKSRFYSLGMNTYKKFFLKNKAKDIGLEELQEAAEYNNKIENGLDPVILKSQLEKIGFHKVRIVYHSNCPSLKKNTFWSIPLANKAEMMVKFLVSGKMSYSYLSDYFIILAQK